MNHKTCLILCAGFGTRMGEIGKELPKPLWPIFEKTILDLQIAFAKRLGCEKIYVNIHHGFEKFDSHDYDDVEFVHEPNILGSGGAIHNLLPKIGKTSSSLIYIAGDQFYFFEKEILKKGFDLLKDYQAVLFSMKAEAGTKYGKLILESDELKEIEKSGENGHSEDYSTFSGIGIINLEKLSPVEGYSDFFKSVAAYENKKVLVLAPTEQEYWDFGTFPYYYSNMFRLLKAKGQFYDFCVAKGFLREEKRDQKRGSYGIGNEKDFLNLGDEDVPSNFGKNSILIGPLDKNNSYKGPGIYFKGFFQGFTLS